jgi:hypothetical protein
MIVPLLYGGKVVRGGRSQLVAVSGERETVGPAGDATHRAPHQATSILMN